ncbi:MAG: type II CRISPR-associated endonuclease Cas1 [Chloroflexi bacterium]|nr:type II CRISPR-associated endonuclease Cas1 [Chloroflexota bacterium]
MIGRVIEIASEGQHLGRKRGLMTVSCNGAETGRVPLDDIGVLLCNARGLTYSNDLLVQLAKRGAAVVLCGNDYLPVAWLWPLDGHHVQALRMRCQLEAPLPLRKRLWQATVRAKIAQQRITLEMLGKPNVGLDELARRVKSGDPENMEAQAARLYWPSLFGRGFQRERFGEMPNPLLNYGYTVLRAATARAVAGVGLHPSLGIHHHNRYDAMCLVDDLMEPFRPAVDYRVAKLVQSGSNDVTPEAKQTLVGVLAADMLTERGTTPLETCLERAAQSLAQSFENKQASLSFPERMTPK